MKKIRKKPSLFERIVEKVLLTIFLLFYLPLWFVIWLLWFPFNLIGKIADVLEDAERGISESISAFSCAIAALTPECEWKHRYEKLKKKMEVSDNAGK